MKTENKVSHTPGPWNIEEYNNQTLEIWPQQQNGYGCIAKIDKLFGQFTDSQANARLIAAAPELLEALKAASILLDKKPDNFMMAVELIVNQAIAKAEGG